ncbi:MAG: hypothetical protein O3B75_03205 [Planctomycetota bacterium]|nr:hypothetical protein [Planctomycetota bacterium]
MMRHIQLFEQTKAVLEGSIVERLVIEQIAIEYSEFLNIVQDRITQGLSLARRGLRMELLSLLDAKPPLLTILDQFEINFVASHPGDPEFGAENQSVTAPQLNRFLKLELWRKYCLENTLAIPPLVNTEQIVEIREAVSRSRAEKFNQLHRHFRRQNLALASVSLRLDTLRLLAKRDRKNPLWQQEISRFEIEFIQELRHSLSDAIQKGLLSEAERIMQVLATSEWQSLSEVRLAVSQCEIMVNAAWADHATEHASRLAQQMFASYMAESIDEVREFLVQWETFLARMARGGTEVPTEPLAIVLPIIEWLNLRDAEVELARETKARLEALERATIDPTISATEVQACLIAAEGILAEVPQSLREIAEWRIQAHLAQMKTRRQMKIFAIALGIAAILGFAVWFTVDQIHISNQRAFIAVLEAAVGRNDKVMVEKLILDSASSKNGFHEHPSSLDALKRHAELQIKQDEADKKFEELFAESGDPTAISANRLTIEAAANVARTDEQRERVRQWRNDQNQAEAREAESRNEAFLVDVRKFGVQIDELELLPTNENETKEKLLDSERFADRIAAVGNIAQDAKVAFEIQRSRLQNFRVEVDRTFEYQRLKNLEASQFGKIVEAASTPEKLKNLLSEFSTDFPKSLYAGDFLEVSRNAEQWQAIADWLEVRRLFIQDPIPLKQLDRLTRRLEIQKFRSSHPKCAVDQSVRIYEELLVENSFWVDWLSNTLRTWTPMSMKQLDLKDGTRYFYDPSDPPLVGGSQSQIFSVWKKWNEDEKLSAVIQRADIKFNGPSHQSVLKNRLEEILTSRNEPPSIEMALKIVRIIRDSAEVDPVARATLIDGLLPQIQTSAPYLKAEIELATQALAHANLDGIDWLAPGIPSMRADYKKINDLLRLDIPVDDWIQLQRDQVNAVTEWLRCNLRTVGIIDQIIDQNDLNRRIQIAPNIRLRPKELLYIVTNAAVLVPIGTVDVSGNPLVDPQARSIPSGTLVFAGNYRPVMTPKVRKK